MNSTVCDKYRKLVTCISQIEGELSYVEKLIHELDIEFHDHLDQPIKGTLMEKIMESMHYLNAIGQLIGELTVQVEELKANYAHMGCEVILDHECRGG
jgi:transposase